MAEGEVPGTIYGLSKNGWIDIDLFLLWFKEHFLAYTLLIHPLLLLLDEHLMQSTFSLCPTITSIAIVARWTLNAEHF